MNIETCVNVADAVLFANVFANSRRAVPWVKSVAEHDGQAVIVGGGPSVADWLEEIRWRQGLGQTVFALNGAGGLLFMQGITPDYQVILDARAQNEAFLGFAKHYLLASQAHPILFERMKGGPVSLWHQHMPDNMAEFDAALPADQPEHTLIGGGTTVGLSAMALAYTLGFRKLHLYGYDSSYRGEASHAYPQADSPAYPVTAAGKTFMATLSMAQQAELFPLLSDQLLDLGCLITIRGEGLLPWISKMAAIKPGITEARKYEQMWDRPEYRVHAPGEELAGLFLMTAHPKGAVIDFGAGTGRGALAVRQMSGLPVHMIDFAANCLDPEIRAVLSDDFTFDVDDLAVPFDGEPAPFMRADYGYCTDVMEHVEDVDAVLANIFAAAPRVFFQISTVPDNMGQLIGHKLHLTVRPLQWWRQKLALHGAVKWESETPDAALFYVHSHSIT